MDTSDGLDASRAYPEPIRRPRANALSGSGNDSCRSKREGIASDKFLTRPIRESCIYDQESEELFFRPRKSSSTSMGSNRNSWADHDQFANELQAKRASLLGLDTLQEDAERLDLDLKSKTSANSQSGMHLGKQSKEISKQQFSGDNYPNLNLVNNFYVRISTNETDKLLEVLDPISRHKDNDEDSIEEVAPVPVEDTTDCSQAVIVTQNSSPLVEDEHNSKAFIEKYTGCRSIFMKIPELNLLLKDQTEVIIESSPFTVKIDKCQHGYRLKIVVPATASSISVALVIVKGDHDNELSWPFPNSTVIFRLENISQDTTTLIEKGIQCKQEDTRIMNCLKQPQKGQNEPFGLLNFISKDTLKNELGENPVLSMNCLILPFSKSFTSLKLRQPSLVSIKGNRKQNLRIEPPQVPTEVTLSPCLVHTRACNDKKFPPAQPEQAKSPGYPVAQKLPIVLSKYKINESVSMHTGSTLINMEIPGADLLLNSNDYKTFSTKSSFTVQSSTRRDFSYKAKVLGQVSSDYLSLALIILKGEHDHRLSWPFDMSIIFGLMNEDSKRNRERGFHCYSNGLNFNYCLGRPKSRKNLPIGILHFIPKQALRNGFIIGNSLFIKCLLLPRDFPLSASMKEFPSVIS